MGELDEEERPAGVPGGRPVGTRAIATVALALGVVAVLGGGWFVARRLGLFRRTGEPEVVYFVRAHFLDTFASELRAIDASGGASRVLCDKLDFRAYEPTVSPDGEWVAFIEGQSRKRLVAMKRRGCADKHVVVDREKSPGAMTDLAWSADGRRIGFLTRIDRVGGDYRPPPTYAAHVSTLDGSATEEVAPMAESRPSLRSDLRAYLRVRRDSPMGERRIVLFAEGKERVLATEADSAADPVFSPDGSHVAYVARRQAGDAIVTVFAEGAGPSQKVIDVEALGVRSGSIGAIRYTPDGGRIAFVVSGKTYVVALDGQVTTSLPGTCASFSRDGRFVSTFVSTDDDKEDSGTLFAATVGAQSKELGASATCGTIAP